MADPGATRNCRYRSFWDSGSQEIPTIVTYIHENRETNGKILWQLCRLSNVQLLKVTTYLIPEHEKPHPHLPCLFLIGGFLGPGVAGTRGKYRKETIRSERKIFPWRISLTIEGSVNNEYITNLQRAEGSSRWIYFLTWLDTEEGHRFSPRAPFPSSTAHPSSDLIQSSGFKYQAADNSQMDLTPSWQLHLDAL